MTGRRSICWTRLASDQGLEHLLLDATTADGVVIGFDEAEGAFRLHYRLAWDEAWRLREAQLAASTHRSTRTLILASDGHGRWRDGDGRALEEFDGCLDVDIWPTPFTNTFPIRRAAMAIGERREFRVAWVHGPDLAMRMQGQAYTWIEAQVYRFEALDGSGFRADLSVDAEGLVIDYPGLFRRLD